MSKLFLLPMTPRRLVGGLVFLMLLTQAFPSPQDDWYVEDVREILSTSDFVDPWATTICSASNRVLAIVRTPSTGTQVFSYDADLQVVGTWNTTTNFFHCVGDTNGTIFAITGTDSESANLLCQFDHLGQVTSSQSIVLDGHPFTVRQLCRHPSGNLVIAGEENNGLTIEPFVALINTNGQKLAKWGESGLLDGQFYASPGIVVNRAGHVEAFSQNVQVFTTNGVLLTSYPVGPKGPFGDMSGMYNFAYTGDGLLVQLPGGPSEGALYENKTNFTGVVFNNEILLADTSGYPVGGLLYSDSQIICIILYPDPPPSNLNRFKLVVFRRAMRTFKVGANEADPYPSVVEISQRAGLPWVDVHFRVDDADSSTVETAAVAFINGLTNLNGLVVLRTFEEGSGSQIGSSTPTGVDRHLVWNAAADWQADYGRIQVEILANDGRPMLGLHWLELPDMGNGSLTINRNPITQSELLSCWIWLVARQDPEVQLQNGVLTGLSGIYAGQTLASGATTTPLGRQFLFERLGVREATPAEVAYAKQAFTPSTVHQWLPDNRVGGRPQTINEVGFESTRTGTWVVPLP